MKFILTTMFYCPPIVKMGGQFLFLNSSLDIVAKTAKERIRYDKLRKLKR